MPYNDDVRDRDALDFDQAAERIADQAGRWSAISHPRPADPAKHTDQRDHLDCGESATQSPQARSVSSALAGDCKSLTDADLQDGAELPIQHKGDSPAVSQPKPPPTGRNRRGQFEPGNSFSVVHGLHSTKAARIMAEIRIDFEAASLAEDPAAETSTRRRALHAYRASLHAKIAALDAALDAHGLFDKRGRLRPWVATWLAMQQRAQSLDQSLGLETEPKRVPDVHEELAAAERERQAKRVEPGAQ